MESDFPVLLPALRRLEHLRGIRLFNAKLPTKAQPQPQPQNSETTTGTASRAHPPRFQPLDTYVRIKFVTKYVGTTPEFEKRSFEFFTAPEYSTICPSWHLNLSTSFPTANCLWSNHFEIDVFARPSATANHQLGLITSQSPPTSNSTAAAVDVTELEHSDDDSKAVAVAVSSKAAHRMIQINPHTEDKDAEFLAAADTTASLLQGKPLQVDMSKLIFLPNPKWSDVVQHAQTNTILYLLDDGGGRERWYCDRQFGLHLYK